MMNDDMFQLFSLFLSRVGEDWIGKERDDENHNFLSIFIFIFIFILYIFFFYRDLQKNKKKTNNTRDNAIPTAVQTSIATLSRSPFLYYSNQLYHDLSHFSKILIHSLR